MSNGRYGDWMQTHSGQQFWPLDARVDEIVERDIVEGLSKLCRFTGQCNRMYTVGQHSLEMADYARIKYAKEFPERYLVRLQLLCLLHDASEAYMNDMCRPIKRTEELQAYRYAEKCVQKLIWQKYEVHPDELKSFAAELSYLDNGILATEREQLFDDPHVWDLPERPLPIRLEIMEDWRDVRTNLMHGLGLVKNGVVFKFRR